MITQDDPASPSLPMTGPTDQGSGGGMGPQKRRLDSQEQAPSSAGVDPWAWQAPGTPADLKEEADTPTFAVQLIRRHLQDPMGPRRL